jgi:lysophospholipase L1-like esterase
MSADFARLNIVGFGACMISGYPHERGMVAIACELIEKELASPVTSLVVSLGGFPAPRAQKYLSNKVLDCKPDYVVFQFGSTDAQCPIRKRNRPGAHVAGVDRPRALQPIRDDSYHRKPTTAFSLMRWELISLLGFIGRLAPITPLASHIATIEQMMLQCRSAGAVPVVLSPFVYGSRYTMRNAIRYAKALRDLHDTIPDSISIDCIDLLTNVSRSRILMHDGFHLSEYGHQLIGQAIANSIIGHVRWKNKAAALAA